jgi:hypothetical protein
MQVWATGKAIQNWKHIGIRYNAQWHMVKTRALRRIEEERRHDGRGEMKHLQIKTKYE